MADAVKRIAFFVGAYLMGLLAASASAATPNVGQHIHVEVANHPVDGYPIARGNYTFQVTVRLHAYPAKTQYIRIDDSSTTRAKRTVTLGPCSDCSTSFSWTVDFSGWSVGRHELRWHVDSKDADPNTADTQRQFTTSRQQVCVQSCSPNVGGRASNWHGGGSWYTGPGYVVALFLSPESSLRAGKTVSIRSQYSGATACAYLNPDFHHGSHGTALGCGTSVTIPSSAQPGDRFVIVAKGSQEAGVFEARIGASGPTTFFGAQSWWAKSGLVLP